MESEKLSAFERAHWSLVGQEEAEKWFEKKRSRKCDWSDPADVREWRTELRRRRRDARLPKDRRCPKCGSIKTDSRQWVVTVGSAVCRSCWSRPMSEVPDQEVALDVQIMRPVRYSFDARAFAQARRACGLSAGEFARRMNWSPSYQSRLEGGLVRDVDARVGARILQVLSGQGVFTDDDLSVHGTTT